MTNKTTHAPQEFNVQTTEEETLIRVSLSGDASLPFVKRLRAARLRYEGFHLPILIVDDGLTYIDSVIYGALIQWAQSVRNRNVGFVMATGNDSAARVFQMAGLPAVELVFATEEAARVALDRGTPGRRVAAPAHPALAIEGLRHK